MKKIHKGFSVLEVILASAIFIVFATAIAQTTVGGYIVNRLGEEQTIATAYANEGLEAVRSIKNQNFTGLITSAATGIVQTGGVWTFNGANNTFGKYTRVIAISDVQRDGSGNIVASGGTVDTTTKKATSTVTWSAGPTRNDSVVFSTYLTNFRAPFGGITLYGDGTTTPKYRTYDKTANTFSAQTNTLAGASGNTFLIRTSPTNGEAVAGYITAAGVLQVMCFNGVSWSNDWSVTVGGTGTTRRFDISYETNSGNVVVLYSTNTSLSNELAFRKKNGTVICGSSNWSGATNVNSTWATGTVQWVKMAWDKRSSSNLITAIWADSNADLSMAVWNGSSFVNEPSSATETALDFITAAQDIDNFDVEYESLSGDVMVVWGNTAGNDGVNGVRYRTCTGGISTCTWSGVLTPPTFADDAVTLDLSAHPNTDEMVFASIGNAGNDLQIGYWSGTTWTDTANVDTSTQPPVANSRLVAAGWLVSGATSRSVVVYNDAATNNIGWYVGNAGVFTLQTDFTVSPVFANPQKWYQIETDPLNKDQLMFSLSDNGNDLFAKRLIMTSVPGFTWTNSDGSAALQLTLPQSINSPFSFAYWRI